MLHRPTLQIMLAGAVLLGLATASDPVSADIVYDTVYVPTSSVVTVPSSNVISTSYAFPTSAFPTSYSSTIYPTSYSSTIYPTSYSSTIYPTSTVLSTGSVVYPTSTTSYYRRSIFRPRRYVERTSYTVSPSAFYSPTSYVVPTSYYPTSYVVPTTYYPTSYLSTSYVVPTTYLTTSTIRPTTYLIDTGLVTTSSSYPCETVSSSLPSKSSANRSNSADLGNNDNSMVSTPANGGSRPERQPSGTLYGDNGVSSNVSPPVTVAPNGSGGGRQNAGALPEPPPQLPAEQTPPAPTPSAGGLQIPPAGQAGGTTPPNETTFRSSRRPAFDGRNILRGRVVSAESNRPEEGITVIVSSRTRSFTDRTALTDADGDFKLSLPEGDWTVKVKMPTGSVLAVGRDYVTASGGRVTDSSGRNITDFLITR